MENKETPWGYHLIIDATGCNLEKIKSAENIKGFAKTLVAGISMTAYGEPLVVHFGEGDKEGFTLVQLIETSNISGHFCNEKSAMFLDIFSCKPFDCKTVLTIAENFFGGDTYKVRSQFITRYLVE